MKFINHPAAKGLITGIIMIGFLLLIDTEKERQQPAMQYLVYAIYAAGIIWTLMAARNSTAYQGRFGELFSQGFRCFIVITLLMVVFTGIFIKMHPEFAEQEAIATKEYYLAKGDKMAGDIEKLAAKAKKQYPVTVISISIFRYLIIGAALTAVISGLLARRR
jgi:hypothetical protein